MRAWFSHSRACVVQIPDTIDTEPVEAKVAQMDPDALHLLKVRRDYTVVWCTPWAAMVDRYCRWCMSCSGAWPTSRAIGRRVRSCWATSTSRASRSGSSPS